MKTPEKHELDNHLQRTMVHIRAVSHLAKIAIDIDVHEHGAVDHTLLFHALDLLEQLAAGTVRPTAA